LNIGLGLTVYFLFNCILFLASLSSHGVHLMAFSGNIKDAHILCLSCKENVM